MSDAFFTPVSGMELPRYAGVPTFMRLPHVSLEDTRISEVEIGLIGALGRWHHQPAGAAARAASAAGPVDHDPGAERCHRYPPF